MQGTGYRVQGSGFRVQGAGCRVQGAGCRVQGAGLRHSGEEDVGVGKHHGWPGAHLPRQILISISLLLGMHTFKFCCRSYNRTLQSAAHFHHTLSKLLLSVYCWVHLRICLDTCMKCGGRTSQSCRAQTIITLAARKEINLTGFGGHGLKNKARLWP